MTFQPHLLRKRPTTLADHTGADPVPGQAASSGLRGGTWGEPAWLPWGPGGWARGDGRAATSASLLIKKPDWERPCRLSCKTAIIKTRTRLASQPILQPAPSFHHTYTREGQEPSMQLCSVSVSLRTFFGPTQPHVSTSGICLSCLFGTPWTAAHQAPLSMESSGHEYWSG